MNCPHVPEDLLKYLKQCFKPAAPSPQRSHEQDLYEAGSHKVVEHLQHHFDLQNDTNQEST